jgi:hypothetical protein
MDLSFDTANELKFAVPPVQVSEINEVPAGLLAGKGM